MTDGAEVNRTRSEYRMSPIHVTQATMSLEPVHPVDAQRDVLAELMLDAYRNTIDDEGEELGVARDVMDHYLASIVRPQSFVVFDGKVPVAFSFVVVVNGCRYIDPVVVAPARKCQGLGTAIVNLCLESLDDAGVAEVGATITDGNVASERLFLGLGFVWCGAWL